MDLFAQIAVKIIKAQEAIIGPVAIEQAQRVPHLTIDWNKHEVIVDGDKVQAINALVGIYQELFGQISKEVSKEAAAPFIAQLPSGQLPEALK